MDRASPVTGSGHSGIWLSCSGSYLVLKPGLKLLVEDPGLSIKWLERGSLRLSCIQLAPHFKNYKFGPFGLRYLSTIHDRLQPIPLSPSHEIQWHRGPAS